VNPDGIPWQTKLLEDRDFKIGFDFAAWHCRESLTYGHRSHASDPTDRPDITPHNQIISLG
jgi:hypothetical protein